MEKKRGKTKQRFKKEGQAGSMVGCSKNAGVAGTCLGTIQTTDT